MKRPFRFEYIFYTYLVTISFESILSLGTLHYTVLILSIYFILYYNMHCKCYYISYFYRYENNFLKKIIFIALYCSLLLYCYLLHRSKKINKLIFFEC